MTISADAIRVYEQELLAKAEVLALALTGFMPPRPSVPAMWLTRSRRGCGRRRAIAAMLAVSTVPGEGGERLRTEPPRRPAPVVVAARGGGADDIEDFILDILAENPPGLSVQDMSTISMPRSSRSSARTLVVRLHRMVQAGRLPAQAHGHYILSEAERSRRRA